MLLDLIGAIPSSRTAIVLPEHDRRVSYRELTDHIRSISRRFEAGEQPGREGFLEGDALSTVAKLFAMSEPAASGIVFRTRGTSGRPKAVRLSHEQLAASARITAGALALSPDDVSLCVMAVSSVHGFVVSTLAALAAGGTVVMPERFHPLAFWRVARDYGVTWYSAEPRHHQLLLARSADPGARRPPGAAHLRFIRSSGASLPVAVQATLESAFGAPVIEAYDVTEAAGPVASNRLPPEPRTPGSVGRPVAGISVSILETGEITIAGPTVAAGYVDDAVATRKDFVGGRFHTGDFGYVDTDGNLTLTEGTCVRDTSLWPASSS